MNTAKQNFNQFVYTNQTMLEVTKQQCEQKMATLQSSRVTYAIFWTLFWWIMGPLGFIFSLFFNITNYSKRSNYKDVELMRIQMKVNQFIKYETPQQQAQEQNQVQGQQPVQMQQPAQMQQPNLSGTQPVQSAPAKKVAPIVYPVTRQLDFANLSKEKIIQILEVSDISFKATDSIFQLGAKANENDIAWKKLPESLIKEVLDINGVTYKLNITKPDLIKLLK